MPDIANPSDDLDRDVLVKTKTVDGQELAVPVTALIGDNTREYGTTGFRRPVATTSAAYALPTLGPDREIYVRPSVACFIKTGVNDQVAAAAGTATTDASHPVAAEERWHFRVPAGHTHIAVICESGTGFLTVMPVA